MTRRRDIIKALEDAGFVGKGGTNHEKWFHEDGRPTVVGRHRDIPQPTARLIARQAKIELPERGVTCQRSFTPKPAFIQS